jgi:hypothetical protein
MTIVEDRPVITGGVDTHADLHVAAALDPVGGLLGVRQFPATAAGYADLLQWLGEFGTAALVGIEGTGSYGAGLARHLATAGVRVAEAARAGGTGTGRASPIRWMRSARRGPRSPGGHRGHRRAGTGRWRRSGR